MAVAFALGDMGGERLGLEGLAEDHLIHRFVHDLLEARHVSTLLLGAQFDEALELGIEELLGPVRADADDLLDARHAHAEEAQVGGGSTRLDVPAVPRRWLGHTRPTISTGPRANPAVNSAQAREEARLPQELRTCLSRPAAQRSLSQLAAEWRQRPK